MTRLIIFGFVCATCLVLAGCTSRKSEDIEQQIEEALKWKDNFVPKTKHEELLKVDLETEGKDFGKFDFIIVGSGSSGSALASRLTEIKNWTVLLLEAGDKSKHEVLNIPFYGHLSVYAQETWNYLTTPQKNACLASKNQQCSYNVGKVFGGNTKTGPLFNGRGNPKDFDTWAEQGFPEWSYEKVLPYFKKLETFTINNDTKYHGFSGPMRVEHIIPKLGIEDASLQAWNESSIPYNPDYTTASALGACRIQYFIEKGARKSAATSYIQPISNRENFHLSLNSFAIKILTDSKTGAAVGVKFVKNGQVYYANSRKDVVIAAGPVHTAQLLWLSGIGPKKDLERLNIPVVTSLPVGLFMKDFPIYDLFVKADYKVETNLKKLITEYLNGEGMLTTTSNYRQGTAVKIPFSNPKISAYVIVLWAPPIGYNHPIATYRNYDSNVVRQSFDATKTFRLSLISLLPSHGTVKLKSKNPADFPEIDPNLLNQLEDLEILHAGVKVVERYLATPTAKHFNVSILTAFPEDNKHQVGSDNFWKTEFQLGVRPMGRPFGTVKMGPHTDPNAVVDSSLKVHNVANLRAVGRGVLPNAIDFTTTIGFMLGEKAADIIKQDYGQLNN